jgi:hypothetical protein
MNKYYICNTEDWSDWWEPEYITHEHIIYAHDEESAKAIFQRKHYRYLVNPWTIEKIADAPDRQRQGFAGKQEEKELCWQWSLKSERD